MHSRPNGTPSDPLRDTMSFLGRLGGGLESFWQRVSEGLEIQVLWAQFVSEARASYNMYAREVDWPALARETRGRRLLKTASALFWAMLTKLSPARRVFLLIALVLGLLALTTARVSKGEAGTAVGLPQNFTLVLFAISALVFLLGLELADRVTMKRDLEIAREIQRWLVPSEPPHVPGVEIAFTSQPANTVGGDYYDAFVVDSSKSPPETGRLLLVVADVAGKSVPAALLMATFQASLRSLAAVPTSLADLVTRVNRYCCAHSLGGRRFTTAFFAEFDAATHALSYIRAGHDEPIMRRAGGTLERLGAGHLPLGINPEEHYECVTLTLAPGDLLLIFTDGVTEAVNEADDELGERRLLEALQASANRSADDTLKHVLAAVRAFTGRARQHDDITGLVLRVA